MKVSRLIAVGGVLGLLGAGAYQNRVSKPKVEVGKLFSGLAEALETRAIAQDDDPELSRLIMVKSMYFFVNGGESGKWPSGEHGKLTGYDAPEGLEGGFLGFVNNILGPKGDISTFLENEGYETCAQLPSEDTEFDVEDDHLGAITVTVGSSTREIPDGLQNSGTFERRIAIATPEETVAVAHLHCSTSIMTMLLRINMEMDNEGQIEAVEAMMEGSEAGPDVHLQFSAQNLADDAEDWAIEFKTVDGDTYSIYIASSSSKTDSNGNGPAHTLAAFTGNRSDDVAYLTMMGGNTDGSAISASSDFTGTQFDSDASFADMPSANEFCISSVDGSEASNCPDAVYPGDLAISGLSDWTIDALVDFGNGTSEIATISTF